MSESTEKDIFSAIHAEVLAVEIAAAETFMLDPGIKVILSSETFYKLATSEYGMRRKWHLGPPYYPRTILGHPFEIDPEQIEYFKVVTNNAA